MGEPLTLPGKVNQCETENCGAYWWPEFCTDCGLPRNPVQTTCKSARCPVGYEDWQRDRVRRIAKRVLGRDLARVLDYQDPDDPEKVLGHFDGIQGLRWIHGTISPAEARDADDVNHLDLEAVLDRAADLAEDWGIKGFVLIPHPWRLRDRWKDALRAEGYGDRRDPTVGGLWEGVREDALDLGGWREYVQAGPHVHVIGHTGPRWTDEARLPPGDEVGRDGDVLKRVGDLGTDPEDVTDLAAYLLSHTGLNPDPDGWESAYEYGGDLQPWEWAFTSLPEPAQAHVEDLADGDVPEALDREPEPSPCPGCGSEDPAHVRPIWEARNWLGVAGVDLEYEASLRLAHEVALHGWTGIADGKDPPDSRSRAYGALLAAEAGEIWM